MPQTMPAFPVTTPLADGVPVAVTTALPCSWLVQPAKQDHKAFQDCPCPESGWIGVSAAPKTPVLENTQLISRNKVSPLLISAGSS